MAKTDTCCTVVPYFRIHDGKIDEFKSLCGRFLAATETEPKCMFYGFTFDGAKAHCREGYEDADGVLAHLDNVGALIAEALTIADLERFELHGPAAEMAKLREPLKDLNPGFYNLELGFRR